VNALASERLQKVLAAAGYGSRRSCEELIRQGRVTVDGEVVRTLGTRVDPLCQDIRCDGERVRPARKVYFLLNKPAGVVCTARDERGRPTVFDLLPHRAERLFTVGRLDAGSEGLLILTNDGDFAQRVAHPRHGVTKTYRVRVAGRVAPEALSRLTSGIWIAGHVCRAEHVAVVRSGPRETTLDMTLREGRKREVRRMLGRLGHRVMHLSRIRIGPLSDPSLRPGRWRKLSPEEVELLRGASSSPARVARRGLPAAQAGGTERMQVKER